MSGYIGNIPVPQATQTRDTFTATASQTTFATSGYTPGFLDVFLNGVHLVNGTDYTATNGSDVVLTSGAAASDVLEVISYSTYEVNDQVFTGDFSVDSPTFVVDSTNNYVGVGTASPVRQMHINATGGANAYLHLTNATTGAATTDGFSLIVSASDGEAIIAQREAQALSFWTSNTERMRVDSSGSVLINTTSTNGGHKVGVVSDSVAAVYLQRNTDTGGIVNFYQGSSGNFVGSISVTTTATAYNTSSDYRLKENVVALDGAAERLAQIPVHRFNFIADPETTVDGFIAHEVQAIVPEAVTGEKDAVDADGNPEFQGIDQSKLVPLLTAALQEALTRIEKLEADVAALKGGAA